MDGRGGPSPQLADELELATMALDQRLGERQAQPDPFVAAVDLWFDLAEGLERRRNILRPHPDAGIDDTEREPDALQTGRHADAAVFGGELDRIGDQVDQRLLQPQP